MALPKDECNLQLVDFVVDTVKEFKAVAGEDRKIAAEGITALMAFLCGTYGIDPASLAELAKGGIVEIDKNEKRAVAAQN